MMFPISRSLLAEMDATWAISSRGFNSSTANKLLVLIDGRSVYTPLYGGVFWDVQDVLLEDVDRRGAGYVSRAREDELANARCHCLGRGGAA